jgi:Rhodopirellula transposase DDE domain
LPHLSELARKNLISHEIVVELIGSTRTEKGLKIRPELDQTRYQTGQKISDEQLAELKLERADFHGEWNYLIHPC